METLSNSEKAWIWTARMAGLSAFAFAAVGLQFEIPTPAYVLIGGMLGGEFVYKASKRTA